MDSLTQALLGSATALLVTKGQSPRRAILYGAALGTLPDLDTLFSHGTSFASVVSHRTWSHSWLAQSAVAPIIAFIIQRFDKSFSFLRWWALVWLAFVTHAGLDALTVYGTDLFWPIASSTVMGGSIFIIDPAYSLLLLLSFCFVLIRPRSLHINPVNKWMLGLSCLYLAWGLSSQAMIKNQAIQQLQSQGVSVDKILVQAAPFNTVLWRVLVIKPEHYYEGFRSIFDTQQHISFTKHALKTRLIDELKHTPAIMQINHFNHGYYSVNKRNNDIIINDLRMGIEPTYTFQFKVAEIKNDHVKTVKPTVLPHPKIPDMVLNNIWRRIFDQSIHINPLHIIDNP